MFKILIIPQRKKTTLRVTAIFIQKRKTKKRRRDKIATIFYFTFFVLIVLSVTPLKPNLK